MKVDIYIVIKKIILASSVFFICFLNYKTGLNKLTFVRVDLSTIPISLVESSVLGHGETFASLYWVKLIGYVGGKKLKENSSNFFKYHIDLITMLDPLFETAYEFAGIIYLHEFSLPSESINILKEGMQNISESHSRYWKLPFFIAYNYMGYYQDNKKAAQFLEISSNHKNRPEFIPLLTARLYSTSNYHNNAISFLEKIIEGAETEELRQKSLDRLKLVINDKNIYFLEKKVKTFLTLYGRYPVNIQELLDNNVIESIPKMKLKGQYIIQKDGRVIHSVLGGKLKSNL